MEFAYECFERARTAFATESLMRVFDICFNSPFILRNASVSDAHYSFVDLKTELSKDVKDDAKIGKLAKGIRDFFSKNISTGGIASDDVRDIITFMSQSLSNSKSRCVVIEDLESSNSSVCNALLKTLEEPFDKSIIILISKRPSALLKTILSRVVRYNFLPPRPDKVKEMLRLSGSPYDDGMYEDVLIHGDGERLKDIRAAASEFYGYVKSQDISKRERIFDIVAPLLRKGFSAVMTSADVASAFLEELSRIAEADFLVNRKYSLFYSSLAERISKASENLRVYNISPADVIGMLMF
jgi:DNA polymerase III delta prime subunit